MENPVARKQTDLHKQIPTTLKTNANQTKELTMTTTMQKYEELFFNDREALEKLIIELVDECFEDNKKAEKQLAEIKEQIAYNYEISADVGFEIDSPYTEGIAYLSSIEEYNKLKNAAEEDLLEARELDEWVELDVPEFGTASISNPEIKVEFIGAGINASTQAKEAFAVKCIEESEENAKAKAEMRIKHAEMTIARMQNEIISTKNELEKMGGHLN